MFAGSVMLGAATTTFASPGSNVVILSQKNVASYDEASEDAQDRGYVGEPEDEELRLREEARRQQTRNCCNPCAPRPIECGENILCGRNSGGICQ
jgi:hypothetical protein